MVFFIAHLVSNPSPTSARSANSTAMGALVVFLEHLGHLDGRRSNSYRGQQLGKGKTQLVTNKRFSRQKTGWILQDSHHPFFGMLDLVHILETKKVERYYDIYICYYTILYCTALCYTILYYTVLYDTILYYTILCYTILYWLHHTILYYTRLHYTIRYL